MRPEACLLADPGDDEFVINTGVGDSHVAPTMTLPSRPRSSTPFHCSTHHASHTSVPSPHPHSPTDRESPLLPTAAAEITSGFFTHDGPFPLELVVSVADYSGDGALGSPDVHSDARVGNSPGGLSLSAMSRSLGRGCFGSVAEAYSPVLGRAVAVKTVNAAAQPASAAAEMAFAERALATEAALDGAAAGSSARLWAHVARVHGAARDGSLCSVSVSQELLEGGEVGARAAFREPSPPSSPATTTPTDSPTAHPRRPAGSSAGELAAREARLRRVARDVLSGLAVLAEDMRVVHRDVKPSNVVLTADGTAKLVDFGCCAVLPEGAASVTDQQGSVLYMAPERLRGEAHSFASDVWSVGVTVLQLALCGQHPFVAPGAARDSVSQFWLLAEALRHTAGGAAEAAATRTAVLRAASASGLSAPFCAFAEACCTADASARPSAAELLGHAWLAVDA